MRYRNTQIHPGGSSKRPISGRKGVAQWRRCETRAMIAKVNMNYKQQAKVTFVTESLNQTRQ